MNNKIKLDKAEIEEQPGGKTKIVTMTKFDEEKKNNLGGISQQPSVQKDTLYNLFLSHLLRPREWTA